MAVIASGAKQPRGRRLRPLACFAPLAMTARNCGSVEAILLREGCNTSSFVLGPILCRPQAPPVSSRQWCATTSPSQRIISGSRTAARRHPHRPLTGSPGIDAPHPRHCRSSANRSPASIRRRPPQFQIGGCPPVSLRWPPRRAEFRWICSASAWVRLPVFGRGLPSSSTAGVRGAGSGADRRSVPGHRRAKPAGRCRSSWL